jgi:hypothetical protein
VFEHAGIFFDMGSIHFEVLDLSFNFTRDHSSCDNRLIKLCDLKIFWAIRVEIGFAIKLRDRCDACVDGTPKLDGFTNSLSVQNRKRSRLSCANNPNVCIWLAAK